MAESNITGARRQRGYFSPTPRPRCNPNKMKGKLTDDLRSIYEHVTQWLDLEVEYVKLTAAEKITILSSAVVLGFVSLLMALLVMILLSFALVGVFEQLMSPALAYLSVAGIVIVLMLLIFLLRKPILTDPIARFITRLLLEKKDDESKTTNNVKQEEEEE